METVDSIYEKFKTPAVSIIFFFIALFFYIKIAGPIPFFINSVNTTKTELFSSSGEGKATAVPDTSLIYLGVTQKAENVVDAQNKTNTSVKKIIKDLENLGIKNKDIKTTNYSLTPNYSMNPVPLGAETQVQTYPIFPQRNQIPGFTVTQNLEVKVKPINKVNQVIDTVTADGANLIGGVNFTFSDELEKSLEQKARQEAVANAKIRAQSLANAAGMRLGRIVNVVESSNSLPKVVPFQAETGEKTNQNQASNITPGENSITVSVDIYYETF